MKGIIFTLDAIVAFGIIVAIISGLIVFRTEIVSPYLSAQKLHLVSEDILGILYNSNLGDIVNRTLLNQYIASGILSQDDLNKKTMDVLGALWAAGNKKEAANITKDILEDFIPNNTGYQILINDEDFYNSSDTARPQYGNALIRISSSRIISGYEKYKPVSGYVARAWATRIKKVTTKIIPINLAWGSYTENLDANNRYWYNGYVSDATLANRWSIIIKNFTLPDDANITSAYMQMAFDTDYANITINGNRTFTGSGLAGVIREFNITGNVTRGLNNVSVAIRRVDLDLGHFHPGCYIKVNYNTSEVESGSNETVFNADWIRGAPAANEIIPFFVNAQIRNVTAYVDIQGMNAFLLLTLNYKYNKTNPMQNVVLYKEYPQAIDCSQYTTPPNCQAHPAQCSWNPNTPVNYTVFHSTFDSVDRNNNCQGVTADGWTDCITGESTLFWRAVQGGSRNSSSLRFFRGDDIDTANATYITKCLDLSSYYNAYLSFDWSITGLDPPNEYILIRVNKTGSSTLRDLWNSGSGNVGWNNKEINVTNNISSNTCFRIYCSLATDSNEYCDLDDFKIIGTKNGKCENSPNMEDVKNRTFEIIFNQTGSLINEYNSTNLVNASFNPNVTINNVFSNMTNTFGIYADIRAPKNLTVPGGGGDVDWQRLGMYAHNGTSVHPGDYYCYITDKSNITVYHDLERYGLEYGKVDISSIVNFTDIQQNCITKNNVGSCKDAFLNLSFSFPTNIRETTILGTQDWGGNDNGYNFIWTWVNNTEPVESHLVMDTDTPPGTFASIPTGFLQIGKTNVVRVGDKDDGRYLDASGTAYMGNKRSIVEYTFLVPSQVGYGDVFNTSNEAVDNATKRLNEKLGSFASATILQNQSFKVGGVPYMYGPYRFKVNVWV
jgi:hypothetical protein